MPHPQPLRLDIHTLLTQAFCLMCNIQELWLGKNEIGDKGLEALSGALATGAMARCTHLNLGNNKIGDMGLEALSGALATGAMAQCTRLDLDQNQIGDAGMIKFSEACAGGAMAQLTVSWLPTALIPCLETWHACSPGLTDLFDVPYVLCAEAWPQRQPDWRPRRNGFGPGIRRWGNGTLKGELASHCLVLWPWHLACALF